MILFEVQRIYQKQWYLEAMYKALFALGYYGLFRVGELTHSPHTIKARDVHMGMNKDKVLIVLYSSKTHDVSNRPQKVKITANYAEKSGFYVHRNFCPFKLLHNYLCHRGAYDTYNENFFVFKDKSPVKAEPTRKLLKKIITTLGLNNMLYDMHSLRIGRASDLIKYNYSIDEVRRLGRWKSNVVYKYIRN